MHLLLISNSTNYGEEYLAWPKDHIRNYLAEFKVKRVLFVPYAGVGLDETSLEASLKYADSEYIELVDEIMREIKENTRFGGNL